MEQSKVLMQTKKLKVCVMVCAVLFGLWFMGGYVYASNNISTDPNAPVSISLGETEQEITGPKREGYGISYNYYKFTLQEAATVTGTSEVSHYELYNNINLDTYVKSGDEETINWELKAGTYILKVTPYKSYDYTMKLKSTPFNWGNVNVQWSSKFPCPVGKLSYTVTVTGGDSRVYIFDIIPSSGQCDGDEEKTTAEGSIVGAKAGEHTLTVVLDTPFADFGRKEVKIPYILKPETPSCSKYDLTVVNNGAVVKVPVDNSYVEVYKNGKWQTVNSSGKSAYSYVTIAGLKANTKYKYRVYAMENGYKSNPSKAITFYTAHKAKPTIKSVKVSKVKTKKYPKQWHSGYYDGIGNWHDGYYSPAYTVTSFKLTVTLKKNPSKGASTYVYINGAYCKAKGKKYTVTCSYIGKPGKKVSVNVRFGRDKTYGGLGKSVSKKVKVKK